MLSYYEERARRSRSSFDGDHSHFLEGWQYQYLRDHGFHILSPKPNTTIDTQWADLVCFPVMQPLIRSAVSARQRLIRRLPSHMQRNLGPEDAVAIVQKAILAGMSEKNIRKAWNEAGHVPFTRRPLHQEHIYSTKGATDKTKTIDYEKIDYSKPVRPQLREILGKGKRLTTGTVCGKLMTDPENVKLFSTIDLEKKEEQKFNDAKNRLAKGAGNEESRAAGQKFVDEYKAAKKALDKEYEDALVDALNKQSAGQAGDAEIRMIKSALKSKLAKCQKRRARETASAARGGAPQTASSANSSKKRRRRRNAARAPSDDSDSGDSSSDDEDGGKGKDLIGKHFVDEGIRREITGFGTHADQRVLFYNLPDGEEVFSGVGEVRSWVEATRRAEN